MIESTVVPQISAQFQLIAFACVLFLACVALACYVKLSEVDSE